MYIVKAGRGQSPLQQEYSQKMAAISESVESCAEFLFPCSSYLCLPRDYTVVDKAFAAGKGECTIDLK